MRRFDARARWVAPVLVLATVLVAAGCSDDGGSDSGSGSDRSTTVTTAKDANRSFSVDTPAGTVSLSLDGELPPGWPSDFPLPKQTKVAGSGSLVDGGEGTMVAVYTSKQSAKDVYDFYTGQSSLRPSDGKSAGIGDAFTGSLKIADPSGSVTVVGRDSTYLVVVLDAGGSSASSSTTASTTSTTAAAGGGTSG